LSWVIDYFVEHIDVICGGHIHRRGNFIVHRDDDVERCKPMPCVIAASSWGRADRPQKITFAAMRDSGVRGILVATAT
jgi:hypothetical protein